MQEILPLINNIWKEVTLPSSWKQVVVVLILKQGKEALQTGSYRPIALNGH